jgi:hypothetical protein
MEATIEKVEESKDAELTIRDIKSYQSNLCHIEINLKKVNDEETAVEFTRIGGDPLYFHDCFKELSVKISEI